MTAYKKGICLLILSISWGNISDQNHLKICNHNITRSIKCPVMVSIKAFCTSYNFDDLVMYYVDQVLRNALMTSDIVKN